MKKLLKLLIALLILLTLASTIVILHREISSAMNNSGENVKRGGNQNRLSFEKSPYLLQHADNPVDWYPWGDEAFERARMEDKPIFLSIGYSTCHWCHVMERESFDNEEVADLMNDAFICIKVDREERPDIDNIYMNSAALLGSRGGWPLTILMTPDKIPFFAATYIPRESGYGNLGLLDLIPRVKEIWKEQKEELVKSAHKVLTILEQSADYGSVEELDPKILDAAFDRLYSDFDNEFGGFSSAPKFPTPHVLMFLLRYWKYSGDSRALEMVEKTLSEMRRGGIYDHAGFGFHRYSTDREWLLPHFEKMLYDQALLAIAYLETYQETGKGDYAQTAREIFEYVLRDMTDPSGGFYSAEDADSEGEEGRFYVWKTDEVKKILGNDAELFMEISGFDDDGNFKDQAAGDKTGYNIIHTAKSWNEISKERGFSENDLRQRMGSALRKLYAAREKRIHPYKDDKILSDWNGLMIAALAIGGRVLNEPQFEGAARKAADFILENLRDNDEDLQHRYRGGEAGIAANLDDYAFLIWGLIELYETSFHVEYLREALSLNNKMMLQFGDSQNGGYYFTSEKSEKLLIRPKEIFDGAVPSGNAVAAYNMMRLGRITADQRLEAEAGNIFNMISAEVERIPSALTMHLTAFSFAAGHSFEIVISGGREAGDTVGLIEALNSRFIPNKVVIFRPDEKSPEITNLAPYTRDQAPKDGIATAYVCRDFACNLPTTLPGEMLSQMETDRKR